MFTIISSFFLFLFINVSRSYLYNDTSDDCDLSNKITNTDHVLFEYEIFFQNGTLGSSIKKPQQLVYLNISAMVYFIILFTTSLNFVLFISTFINSRMASSTWLVYVNVPAEPSFYLLPMCLKYIF